VKHLDDIRFGFVQLNTLFQFLDVLQINLISYAVTLL